MMPVFCISDVLARFPLATGGDPVWLHAFQVVFFLGSLALMGTLGASAHAAPPPRPDDGSWLRSGLAQALLEAQRDAAVLITRSGRIAAANHAFQRETVPLPFPAPHPLLGRSYIDLWRSANLPFHLETAELLRGLADVLDFRQSDFVLEYPWTEGSQQKVVEIMLRRLDVDGQVLFVATHRDLSELVNLRLDLEDRDRLINQYKDQQEELQLILDSVHAQIWHIDTTGRILRLNTAARVAGAPTAAPPSATANSLPASPQRSWRLSRVWANPEEQEQRNQLAIETGQSLLGSVEKVVTNSVAGWASVDRIPTKSPSGKVTGLLVVIDDITSLKQTEEKLLRDESFLAEMGSVAKVGGWELDLRTNQLRWSPQVYAMHEVPLGAPITVEQAISFYRDDSREAIRNAVAQAIETRQGYELELALRTAKGSEIWIHTIGKTECEDGRVVRVFGAIQDVTDRRRASESLRESEERFQLAARATSDGLWDWSPVKDTVWWSEGYHRILGFAVGEITPSIDSWLDLIHPEDRERVMANFQHGLRQENVLEEQYRMVRQDGTILHVADRALVMRNSAGQPLRLVGGVTDITQRRTAEDARNSLEKQLRQAQKMEAIGTLAGGIAHDFNNILGAILSSAELLLLDAPESHPFNPTLQAIFNAGKRARDLIRQILTFSRQEEQKRTLLHLKPIVREAVNLLRATIPSTTEILYDLGDQLPSVIADPIQIHQVIMNLCTNAAHAMRNQLGRLELRLARVQVDEPLELTHCSLQPGLYVRLTVGDNGHGMTKETVRRIFEPFFTTKGPQEGTGLGLSVVLGIVKAYNGAISLQSSLGMGTTFDVYFPAVEEEVADPSLPEQKLPTGSGECILLVDDESVLLGVNTRILHRLGYNVKAFECPDEALRWIRSNPGVVDLLVTDLTMPKLTGLQLSQAVVRLQPGTPVILTSGLAAQVSREEACLAGVTHILPKPVTLEILGATIQSALASHGKAIPGLPM